MKGNRSVMIRTKLFCGALMVIWSFGKFFGILGALIGFKWFQEVFKGFFGGGTARVRPQAAHF